MRYVVFPICICVNKIVVGEVIIREITKELRPVTYRWDRRSWYTEDSDTKGTPDGSKKRDRLHIGFLAQEFMEVEKKHGYASKKDDMLIVNQDENDEDPSYGIKYERLVPVLVNAIKELEARLSALEG